MCVEASENKGLHTCQTVPENARVHLTRRGSNGEALTTAEALQVDPWTLVVCYRC